MYKKPITVTQPYLPPLEEFIPYLQQILDNKWLTNNGPLHQQLETELAEYLGVQYISLFSTGINAKLNEVQAAYGLLQLKYVDSFIQMRKEITYLYRKLLKDIPGISCLNDIEGVTHAYPYFPILINEEKYGMSRDALYERLKEHNIFCRRYFYPLISNFEPYNKLLSAKKNNLLVASKITQQVLCLPIYLELDDNTITKIVNLLKKVA